MWAEAQRAKITEIVALHRDAVSTVWQIACTLQKVWCARKAVGEVEVRCNRSRSPQPVMDQVARTSPTVF